MWPKLKLSWFYHFGAASSSIEKGNRLEGENIDKTNTYRFSWTNISRIWLVNAIVIFQHFYSKFFIYK